MCGVSYGLTDYSLKEDNKAMFKEHGLDEVLDDSHRFTYNDIMIQALKDAMPSCSKFLTDMKEVGRKIAQDNNGIVAYTNPLTGFPVVYQERVIEKRQVSTPTGHSRIQVVLNKKTDKVNTMKTVNGFSPNFVHGLDSTLLVEVGKRIDFDIATIHDSIASHPNHCDKIRHAYNTVMVDMNKKNIVQGIVDQFKVDVTINQMEGDIDSDKIINSLHSLC